MTKADQVRAYALRVYISPARQRGDSQVTIIAGSIAKDLKLSDRIPLVCDALGALKFWAEYHLRLLKRTGPWYGAAATFTFELVLEK
jgi:hypothetical protein